MKPNIITPSKLPLRKKKAQNRDNKNIQGQQEGMINGNKDETKEPRRSQVIQDKQDEKNSDAAGDDDDYDDEEDEYVDEGEISNDGRVYESDFYGLNQDKEYISGSITCQIMIGTGITIVMEKTQWLHQDQETIKSFLIIH